MARSGAHADLPQISDLRSVQLAHELVASQFPRRLPAPQGPWQVSRYLSRLSRLVELALLQVLLTAVPGTADHFNRMGSQAS